MTTPVQMPRGWQSSLLSALGAPPSDTEDEIFLDNWFDIEHGAPPANPESLTGGYNEGGAFNPFDTTLRAKGSSSYNSVGVQNYPSFKEGEAATVATLEEPQYKSLLAELRSGHASVAALERTEDASPWGTAFPSPSNAELPVPKTSSAIAPHVTKAELASFWSQIGQGVVNPGITGAKAGSAISGLLNTSSWKGLLLELAFIGGGIGILALGAATLAKGPTEKAAETAGKVAPLAVA